ncbi:MAG: universal stress protein [Verrucomicrobiae bacterium]|nr:universal stress protein [Verrucomicrobiae bacterium]
MKIQFPTQPEMATALPIRGLPPTNTATSTGTSRSDSSDRNQGPSHILVPVDFSGSSRYLVRQAAALARETNARMTLIYVQTPDWVEEDASNPLVADSYHDLGEAALARLRQLGEEEVEGAVEVSTLFRVGKWVRILLEVARAEQPDLIVAASEERSGLLSWLRTSPLEQLIRQASCPVVVLPERLLLPSRGSSPPALRQVVVAAGVSEDSRRAVKHAAALARQMNGRLLLLHVTTIQNLGTRLNLANGLKLQKEIGSQARQKLLDWLAPEIAAGLPVKVLVRSGARAAQTLSRHLRLLNPQLVVVGAEEHTKLGRRFAGAVLRATSAPVVVVGPLASPVARVIREDQPAPLASTLGARVVESGSVQPSSFAPVAATANSRGRVLVVDDDPSVRESLHKLLTSEQYHVTVAGNGNEVIGKVDPAHVDLVLLDLKMQGKNGWVIFRHLRALKPHLPVVLITGMPNRFKLAASAGVNALVEKPLDVPLLLETVRRLVSETETGASLAASGAAVCRHIRSASERLRRQLYERSTVPCPVTSS